ncbi:MAG: hypothetical protein JNJ57_04125 [Saprospiraceae bacterium]|nr:hypothetical protein [Saprospiraceae bacterium]
MPTQTKFWRLAAMVLFLVNLAWLGFFWMMPSHKPMGEKPRDIIIKKLAFDREQINTYDQLITAHRAQISEKQDQIQKEKQQMYIGLSQPQSDWDSLAHEVGLLHGEIERIHVRHFLQIKKICREDQLDEFRQLTFELAEIFHRPPPPKKRPE